MRLGLLLLLSSLLVSPAFAQKVEVDLSELGTTARNEVINANANKHSKKSAAEVTSQWIGVGKEVGEAVNAGLGAVVTSAETFGKTDVGRFTMWLIMWKLFGSQILHIVLGFIWGATGLSIVVWSYRRTFLPRRVLIERGPDNVRKYQLVQSPVVFNPAKDGKAAAATAHLLVFVVIMIVTILAFMTA